MQAIRRGCVAVAAQPWLLSPPGEATPNEVPMMKSVGLIQTLSASLIISALLIALSGCQNNEGPTEGAGAAVDDAASKAGQQIEEAGENIQDAARGN